MSDMVRTVESRLVFRSDGSAHLALEIAVAAAAPAAVEETLTVEIDGTPVPPTS